MTDEVGRTRELPARSVDVAEQKSQWLRCSLWRSLDVPDIRGTRLPDWELHAPASWKSDPDDRVFVYLLAGPCGPCLNALEDVRKATATGREGKRVKLLLLIADNDEARTLPPLEARGFVEASDCHFASVGEESFNRMSTTLRRGTKVGVSLLTDTSGCVVHANIGTWIAAEVVTRSLAADERCH